MLMRSLMDEAGELLGIREVRKMLIRKDYPKLNAEAEIRGKPMSPEWYFGTYMMKNLYGLISPLEPQYVISNPDVFWQAP